MRNMLSVGITLIVFFLLILFSNLYLWDSYNGEYSAINIYSWENVRSSLVIYIIFSISLLGACGLSKLSGVKSHFSPYNLYGIVISLMAIFMGFAISSLAVYYFSDFFRGPIVSYFERPRSLGDFLIAFICLGFIGLVIWIKGAILKDKDQ